jgi:crotonobetainyl-CoA:carnitine CoA-transferase CaiB-like acyl-CoA transferase
MSEKGLLHGIRAVELVHPLGQYCGRLLADLGADVIKVEAPSGDDARRMGPFADAEPARSLYFDYYNTNKRSLALDLHRDDGLAVLKRLLGSADIWIQTDGLDDAFGEELDLRKLRASHPRATLVSITGFGSGGPYEAYRPSSLVIFAMSGLMHSVGPPDGPPVAAPGQLAFDLAATDAASGALMAILSRRRTGQGQEVEVAALETLATELSPSPAGAQRSVRRGNRHADIAPSGVFECQDGAVELAVIMPAQWDALKEVLGQPTELTEGQWDNREFRRDHSDELYELVADKLRVEQRDGLIERAQRLRLPCLPANTIADYAVSVHPVARDYFVSTEHFGAPYRAMPGPPYRFSAGGWGLRTPPPALGEHSRAILANDLGYSSDDVARLEATGAIMQSLPQASDSPQ